MSKYTTEVRFICEQKADLKLSSSASDIDDILEQSWDKIFTTKCEFFDESYRKGLCKKILKHYYLREIGTETVGLWIFWMNTKLEEIMPYYNQLYESSLKEFDPFNDVNYVKTNTRSVDSSRKNDGSNNTTSSSESTTEGSNKTDGTSSTTGSNSSSATDMSKNLYSDTPQGTLADAEDESYLTNITIVTDENTGSSSGKSESKDSTTVTNSEKTSTTGSNDTTTSNTETGKTQETGNEIITGKTGGKSYSQLLEEYRDTMINIDMLVIDEFSELFLNLW